MSIPYRERRLLRHRARALRAADPHLAAMLAVFAQITAADALPATEQLRRRRPRLLCMAIAVSVLAIHLIRAAARGARRGAVRCGASVGACYRRLAGVSPTRQPPAPTARQ